MPKKSNDYATLPDYQRMSDTVDSLSAQKSMDKPAAKTRQARMASRKERMAFMLEGSGRAPEVREAAEEKGQKAGHSENRSRNNSLCPRISHLRRH